MSGRTSETITIAELRIGDLVFLEPDDDEIGRMISRLDKGHFSHVGMVIAAGLMVSARRNEFSLNPGGDPIDLGGVRTNEVATLAKSRSIYIGRFRDGTVDIDAAVRSARMLEEGDSNSNKSEFSFLKLFLVAAGLDSFALDEASHRPARLLAAVQRAALAWSTERQRATGQVPSFFCSELIAELFSLQYTVRDFAPPPDEVSTAGEETFVSNFDLDQLESVLKVVALIVWYDPGFMTDSIRALVKLVLDKVKHPEPVDEAVRAQLEVSSVLLDSADPLARALVTPRMIENDDRIEWIKKLV